MMRRAMRFSIVLLATLTGSVLAQDQVYTIAGPDNALTTTDATTIGGWLKRKALPDPAQVKQVIDSTLLTNAASRSCPARDSANSADFAVVVHAVQWKSTAVDLDRWYVYQGGNPPMTVQGRRSALSAARALGVTTLGVLELHLRTINEPAAVDYRVEVTKRKATNVEHIGDLLKVVKAATGAGAAAAPLPPDVWGGRCIAVLPTSEIIVRLRAVDTTTGQATETSKQVVQNEQLHHWDVSVALPLKRLKGLDYDVENGAVTPKEVDKQSLIGMLDLYLIRSDLSSEAKWEWPHLVGGVAIAKKPLDKYMVGASTKLFGIRAFAGCAWVVVDDPKTLDAGDPATGAQLEADVRRRREAQFVWGLHMSAKSVLDLITGDDK